MDKTDRRPSAGLGKVIKGKALRLAGELGARPDLVIEGEAEETEGLQRRKRQPPRE